MPGYTRHQLKHDRLTDAAQETFSWALGHKRNLVGAGIVLAVLAAALAGGWFYFDRQNEQASMALGQAVRTFDRPLRAAGQQPPPDIQTFASSAERGREAEKQFLAVAEKYPYTRSGEIARYLAGVAAIDAGDTATAERELKAAAGSRRDDFASLAKMALAAFYRSSKRDAEALAIYDQLAEHPTTAVSKPMALLAKAELLERTSPADANRVYQQLRAQDPSGPIGRLAEQRLNNPKK
ncbi:MAG: tetratricopeptide repeat protein [Acidobacteriota bacterium]|nr:tetratricopeptide repeat protein [Acidobacteriota bacterium]